MHDSRFSNQNLGNKLGARPTVRLTENYRRHISGNDIKALLGNHSLQWNDNHYERSQAEPRSSGYDGQWTTSSSVIGNRK